MNSNNRPADKLWKQMSPEEISHFFKLLADRSEKLGEFAYKTSTELAKYLFAANTGAAAGLFLLLKCSEWHRWELFSFFTFCAGTFFVGISYLALASWSNQMSEGWSQDLNAWGRNEISVSTMDAKQAVRFKSWKKQSIRYGLTISFLLLIAGGLMAAVPFYSTLKPLAAKSAIKPIQSNPTRPML